ncbi:MinD/ParA family ATP-binding protein [Arthrobacter antibioticus]|uniref:MinD/ParA family ATP-binding protein n=1 Tax=Arthrobacter sp. H35-MC1 TaxID=3046203 RepID=UPI0024BBBE84|nr:AAA family ATPase [Arthrobacter sp. H35-MC1]MDJ0318612.1 AAA family ATPase [Arthrobacter sp. H35-MC1]
MAIDKSLVQPLPVISAIINSDDTGVLTIDSTEEAHTGETADALRQSLMARVFAEAATHGRPVRVSTMDETGLSTLICSPIGEVEIEDDSPAPAAPALKILPLDVQDIPKAPATPPSMTRVPVSTPKVAQGSAPEAGSSRRALREAGSFLATPAAHEPASQGFRGALNNLGLSLAPSAGELSEREDIALVSKHFAGTRVVAVVNQKGGSNKTPTVANLAAVFGRNGASVVGWDNNPTTGTLGWRTEKGDHSRSALDVIATADALLSPTAQSADINAYVHHQSTDKYDVLRSDSDVAGTHEVNAEEVDVLHRVLTKYYRLILMDSGNNHRSAEWNRMIDHADQLVVPTTNEEDRVEAALLTLQGLDLRCERSAALAANAVVVVSERQSGEGRLSSATADKFRPYVRAVKIVPFDPALKSGQIRYGALQARTQRAWLAAAAAVASGL